MIVRCCKINVQLFSSNLLTQSLNDVDNGNDNNNGRNDEDGNNDKDNDE